MKKLICFDLDGTLLRDDKSISEENMTAIKKALDLGCYISIVTGRSYKSSAHIARELDLLRENCYLINFQGNAIFRLSDLSLMYESSLSKDLVVKILNSLNEKGLYAHTFDYDGIITNKDCSDLRLYNKIAEEPIRFLNHWEELEDKPYPKVISINFASSKGLEEFQKRFFEGDLSKEVSCFFSDPKFLEFCNINSSKGNAMVHLAKILNVKQEDIIAVGDERNDISMIKMAGIGCAMANAHPDAKEIADYITINNNNHSGVAEIIEKFVFE